MKENNPPLAIKKYHARIVRTLVTGKCLHKITMPVYRDDAFPKFPGNARAHAIIDLGLEHAREHALDGWQLDCIDPGLGHVETDQRNPEDCCQRLSWRKQPLVKNAQAAKNDPI